MYNKPLIKNIKIFGERNSGTNFLEFLIEKNIKDINIFVSGWSECIATGWKHGFPKIELFNGLESTLFIFIIRGLNSWIKSMYKNPYHYKKPDNINQFLTKKLVIDEPYKYADVNIYKSEQQNIIHIRNAKIKSYLEFYKKVNNAIFINLSDLQTNNIKFLKFLKTTYGLKLNKYVPIQRHTKTSQYMKNRNYDLIIPEIKNKDTEIEEFVESLKINYYYKSAFYTF